MTDTSRAARIARRQQRRGVVRAGRRAARAMIRAGQFDAMASRDGKTRASAASEWSFRESAAIDSGTRRIEGSWER